MIAKATQLVTSKTEQNSASRATRASPLNGFAMSLLSSQLCMSRAGFVSRKHRQPVICSAQVANIPGSRCPFANAFSISPASAKAKPSPLDKTDSPSTVGANWWLANGKPGQDVPGKLVSGIHRLYEVCTMCSTCTSTASRLRGLHPSPAVTSTSAQAWYNHSMVQPQHACRSAQAWYGSTMLVRIPSSTVYCCTHVCHAARATPLDDLDRIAHFCTANLLLPHRNSSMLVQASRHSHTSCMYACSKATSCWKTQTASQLSWPSRMRPWHATGVWCLLLRSGPCLHSRCVKGFRA